MRPQPLHADEHGEGYRSDRERDQRGFWELLRDAQEIAKEALLADVGAEQLRHLVEHDDEADTRLEARQHRRRDEVGDDPKTAHGKRGEELAQSLQLGFADNPHEGGEAGLAIKPGEALQQFALVGAADRAQGHPALVAQKDVVARECGVHHVVR